jgi:MFS family permease
MSSVTPVVNGQQPAESDHRWLILVIVAIAQLMVVLDATVVNIALPSAQHALGFANSDRQWVVTAYALAFGSLLLLGGRLGDMFSRKRIFIIGLIGFALASALGGAATSFGMLVAVRALQGAFGAILAPSALGTLVSTFRDPRERGRAFGVFGSVAAGGGAVGLISRRGPDAVLLLALVPVRQPDLRRHRGNRRPGLHADQPAGHPAADGLGGSRARRGRPVPHRLRVLPRRDR